MIEKYLETTILPHRFKARFLQMVKQNDKKAEKILQDFKQLSSFSLDINSDGFSSLLGRISDNCLQAFEFGPADNGYEISENKLNSPLKKLIFDLKTT